MTETPELSRSEKHALAALADHPYLSNDPISRADRGKGVRYDALRKLADKGLVTFLRDRVVERHSLGWGAAAYSVKTERQWLVKLTDAGARALRKIAA